MMACLFTLIFLLSLPQESEPAKPPTGAQAPKGRPWAISYFARLDLEYDSNVWLLDEEDQDRLLYDVSGDRISGRFDGMESIEDWIIAPSARVDARGAGLFDWKLNAYAELEWREYAVNHERSHLHARLGAEQKLGPKGRLDLELEIVPDAFDKNHLADATDFTGSVSSSERIYKAGSYREIETALSYRHAVVESDDFDLDGFAAVGVRARNYSSVFDTRDELSLPFELGVRSRAWKRATFRLAWKIEQVDSPSETEVLLLDEPFFGTDLNGDGDILDLDARSEQTVDRSRRENSLILKAEVEATPEVSFGFEWVHTWKAWSSDQTYDLAHRGRRDDRDRIEFGAAVRLDREWELRAAYEYTVQDTDRNGDPDSTGETLDYERSVFVFSVIFRG